MLKLMIGLAAAAWLLVSVAAGVGSQRWAPWWFAGASFSPPGVLPPAAIAPPQGPLPDEGSALMRAIQPWMGVRYLFGGNDRGGVDCSAFTLAVFRQLGVSLPRTAQQQFNATERVDGAEPGDLIFFQGTYSSPDRITHVGIYVGSGWMISAAEPSVGRQSLSQPFWQAHFAGIGRIRR